MIPVNPFPCYDNSVTSCGNVVVVVVVETRPGLEDLDRESIIITESADEGMSLGIGRLSIGNGFERPFGYSRVGEGRVSSNR